LKRAEILRVARIAPGGCGGLAGKQLRLNGGVYIIKEKELAKVFIQFSGRRGELLKSGSLRITLAALVDAKNDAVR